jgi:SAM-dependent methyltransferase
MAAGPSQPKKRSGSTVRRLETVRQRWWRFDRLRLRERFRPPEFTPYGVAQAALVAAAMDDRDLRQIFAENRRLPNHYGVGLDERVVELPWAVPRLRGRVLDAGSSLNHAHVLDRVLVRVTSLHIVTSAPEPQAFPERGITYVYADFRQLPFDDGSFDTIACVSSLEHVGMDNTRYGGPPREADPNTAVATALDELVRVLAPDGTLLLTVPFGSPEDHGWLRQYGEDELVMLQQQLRARELHSTLTVFAYQRDGWRRSTASMASGQHYRDWHADPSPVPDLAAAARAVACIEAVRGAP